MSRPTDRNQLLADVLADAEPTGFREALLVETLRLVGRRRRVQRFRRISVAVAALGVIFAFAWEFLLPGHRANRSSIASHFSVRTTAFPASAVVRTQALASDRIVVSIATVALVHTTPTSGSFRTIDDDTLLACAAPRSAVLVRVGPHAEELILLTPDAATSARLN
jgi:hypothetical protein